MAVKLTGVVTSDIQDKTIVVTRTSRETHPVYGKQYTVSRKYTAHDEKNEAKKGDVVELVESRPFSKNKTWNLVRIVEAGHAQVEIKEEEIVAELEHKKEVKHEEDAV